MNEDNFLSPYCIICNSCGEEGCCPPTKCEQHPDGVYCGTYLAVLKANYIATQKLLKELPEEYQDKFIDYELEEEKSK